MCTICYSLWRKEWGLTYAQTLLAGCGLWAKKRGTWERRNLTFHSLPPLWILFNIGLYLLLSLPQLKNFNTKIFLKSEVRYLNIYGNAKLSRRTKTILKKNMKTGEFTSQILTINLRLWYVLQCGLWTKMDKLTREQRVGNTHISGLHLWQR